MSKEIDNLFSQAQSDLQKAQILFNNDSLDGAAFFCQQSVEKALKALLIKKTDEFSKIHDIVALSRMVKAPDDIIGKCKIINPYYTETRYPDYSERIPAESFSRNEIDEVLTLSDEVIKWVKSLI